MSGAGRDRITRIAVIVAMTSELRHLPGLPEDPGDNTTPWPAVEWTQDDVTISLVQCGIGTIRAAAATEHVIARWHPDAVLNFGCAGSHRSDVRIGDVVIGTRTVAHASAVIPPDGIARFDLHDGGEAPSPGTTGVSADPGLLAIAREAATGWSPAAAWHGASAETVAPLVHQGVVASADIWTQSHAAIETLTRRHLSLCEDMEAAAMATVCQLHQVPFLTIKDISNNELLNTTIFDPEMCHLPETEVGRRAATLTGRVIERIAAAAAMA